MNASKAAGYSIPEQRKHEESSVFRIIAGGLDHPQVIRLLGVHLAHSRRDRPRQCPCPHDKANTGANDSIRTAEKLAEPGVVETAMRFAVHAYWIDDDLDIPARYGKSDTRAISLASVRSSS
jgi:hypothetical protein